MNISVISATFNRAGLLNNALYTYARQSFPGHAWEYILVDDGSEDNTKGVVEAWQSKGLPIVLVTSEELGLPKKPGLWRDGCALVNRASTIARGKFLILTHPEIMIPPDALLSMYGGALVDRDKRTWMTAIPYWMPPGVLPKGWKSDLTKINHMPGFYDPTWPDYPMQIDYRNQNQERRDTWESWVFNGLWMRDWRWMGGFQEFDQWGSVDIDQANRRKALGIETTLTYSENTPHKKNFLMVYHQSHDSKRDADLAMKGVKGKTYPDAESARKVGGLYNIYYHGPRERAVRPGTTEGIMGDHLSRYRWAANFCHNADVLDIPCGTGYGSRILSEVGPGFNVYRGVDIDGESIHYAQDNYALPGARFFQGDMTKIELAPNSIDKILCFEGIEHISMDDKVLFINEMWRILRPGGTFIISTPNPSATQGTAWDKYMIPSDRLIELFKSDGRWTNLDKFFQRSYSMDAMAVESGENKDAQIFILGGTVIK